MRRGFAFGDLFCGAGLFSAGLVAAGMRPAFAIDIDKEATATYAANLGDIVRCSSVDDVSDAPRVEIIIAGPPCQGFSTLGRRQPTDSRNRLGLAIVPWVTSSKPYVVAIENVPPFLRSPQWRALTKRLVALGYFITTWELDAADFGTAQHRRRAFTIASKFGEVRRPMATRGARTTSGDVLLRSPPKGADPMHRWPEPSELAAKRIALVPPNGDKRDIARTAPELCPPSWGKMGCQATDAWGRIDPNEPANTIRCTFQNPSKGRYLHPLYDRVLSLREGARLQGVDDAWMFSGKSYPVARQIGNGVPVPLARAVGLALRKHLEVHL